MLFADPLLCFHMIKSRFSHAPAHLLSFLLYKFILANCLSYTGCFLGPGIERFRLTFWNQIFMPPTLKKLEGHIAFGLSVCVSVCASVNF